MIYIYDETNNYHHGIDTKVTLLTVFSNVEVTIKQLSRTKISVAKCFL